MNETWNTCPDCELRWKSEPPTPQVLHRTRVCEHCLEAVAVSDRATEAAKDIVAEQVKGVTSAIKLYFGCDLPPYDTTRIIRLTARRIQNAIDEAVQEANEAHR